jgi:hypothetical protein
MGMSSKQAIYREVLLASFNNGTIHPLEAATLLALLQSIWANHQLQVLQVQESLRHTAQIQYCTALNMVGQLFLPLGMMSTTMEMHAVISFGMWPWILERAQKQVKTSRKNNTELVPHILLFACFKDQQPSWIINIIKIIRSGRRSALPQF